MFFKKKKTVNPFENIGTTILARTSNNHSNNNNNSKQYYLYEW